MNGKKQGQVSKTKRRRITTVEDILATDDVNSVMANLQKAKPKMKSLIAIYNDGEYTHWETTQGTPLSEIIFRLELVKTSLLTEDSEDD